MVYIIQEYVTAAMIGTELFGIKLRCWQALCVLAGADLLSDEDVTEVAPKYFTILSHNCCNAIRVPMEIWAALIIIKHPGEFLFSLSCPENTVSGALVPHLMRELTDFNLPQQKLASILVILGHLSLNAAAYSRALSSIPTISCRVESLSDPLSDAALLEEIVHGLLPHLASAGGLPRTIAQLLIHDLVPKYFCSIGFDPTSKDDNEMKDQLRLQFLRSLYRTQQHLHNNRDTTKMLVRQRQFFEAFRLHDRSTVCGLQSLGFDVGGEMLEDHLINIIGDTLRFNMAAEAVAIATSTDDIAVDALSDSSKGEYGASLALQTKIIPFDALHLSICESLLSRFCINMIRPRVEIF